MHKYECKLFFTTNKSSKSIFTLVHYQWSTVQHLLWQTGGYMDLVFCTNPQWTSAAVRALIWLAHHRSHVGQTANGRACLSVALKGFQLLVGALMCWNHKKVSNSSMLCSHMTSKLWQGDQDPDLYHTEVVYFTTGCTLSCLLHVYFPHELIIRHNINLKG